MCETAWRSHRAGGGNIQEDGPLDGGVALSAAGTGWTHNPAHHCPPPHFLQPEAGGVSHPPLGQPCDESVAGEARDRPLDLYEVGVGQGPHPGSRADFSARGGPILLGGSLVYG